MGETNMQNNLHKAVITTWTMLAETTPRQDHQRTWRFGDWQPTEVQVIDTLYGDFATIRENMEECGYELAAMERI
jgi:hypothetical protein